MFARGKGEKREDKRALRNMRVCVWMDGGTDEKKRWRIERLISYLDWTSKAVRRNLDYRFQNVQSH